MMPEPALLLQLFSGVATFALAVLALLTRRFGPSSSFLAFFLLPASLAPLALAFSDRWISWSETSATRAAYCFLLLSTPAAVRFTESLVATARPLRRRRLSALLLAAVVIFLALIYYLPRPLEHAHPLLRRRVDLLYYASGLYLLGVSVIVLSRLERTLRGAEEHVRWEIKFLILGLATPFVALVYLASRIVAYSSVSRESLEIVTFLLLPASVFMFVSWRRSSGQGGVRISQRLAYSTLTFFFVGSYLLASSALARWAGSVFQIGVDAQVLLLFVMCLALATLFLSARLRSRMRDWVRRNVFSGTYDYRASWMEAAETIRDSDPPDVAASAVCSIVQRALGSLDVSVWVRSAEQARLRLLAARGPASLTAGTEVDGVLNDLSLVEEPLGAAESRHGPAPRVDPGFFAATGAALLVPLRSGEQVLGVLTVGRDPSGRPFDGDAREFLRVIAAHAASEFHKRELLKVQVQAKEDEAFRTFSTFLLHDLKNFATTLSMVARNAVKHQENPDFRRDAFQSIMQTAEKMQELCNSLGTFSSSLAADRRPADLNQVVEDAVADLDHSLAVRIRLDLGELRPVEVDPEEIGRVIHNLLVNAFEASPPDALVSLRTSRVDGTAELAIADRGSGIPRDFLERELFTPFRTTKSSGLGIGLFQSKKIVEAHGGAIVVESAEGEGTTVRVRIPEYGPAPASAVPAMGRNPARR